MQKRSLKNYTLRYFVIAILVIIAIWAASFYFFIIEEVYDNIDDGLKDSEIRIKNEIDKDAEILRTDQYSLGQFRITALQNGNYRYGTHIYNDEIYMPYDDDDEPVRILQNIFLYNGSAYLLEIYTSTVEEDELLEDLLFALLVLYFALVISLILINHFILKRAWSPFYRLLARLKAYQIGNKDHFERSNTHIKEFRELENELAAMIHRNEKAYEQQNQFIGNASHELQTPLAIVANKLELLMEDEGISEDQMRKIGEIDRTMSRMKRLNKSLLTLSRIENQQFKPSESLSLNKFVHQSLDDFGPLIEFREIQVSIDEDGKFESEINVDLGIILFANLFKNAILHSPKKGNLSVRISDTMIAIKNSGEKPLDGQKIFERFYKDEQNENSTGLGLAIVRSIVNLYPSLAIGYRFENGHLFELKKIV